MKMLMSHIWPQRYFQHACLFSSRDFMVLEFSMRPTHGLRYDYLNPFIHIHFTFTDSRTNRKNDWKCIPFLFSLPNECSFPQSGWQQTNTTLFSSPFDVWLLLDLRFDYDDSLSKHRNLIRNWLQLPAQCLFDFSNTFFTIILLFTY